MAKRTTVRAHPDNFHEGRIGGVIRYIVIHSGETSESTSAAEGMGNWFANRDAQGSAHKSVDPDSICTHIDDEDTAFGAPYVNADGLHLEQAGRASQTAAQWNDEASRLIIANAAEVIADWSETHKIPLRPMTDAQLVARNYAGVITHAQATRAFQVRGGHSDPGVNYPFGLLLQQANKLLGVATPPSKIVLPPVRKPAPKKIWLKVDGHIGRATRSRLQQFLKVGVDGIWGEISVRAIQRWVGTKVDGDLGPKTWAGIQRKVGAKPDGVPGPLTIRALQTYLNRMP